MELGPSSPSLVADIGSITGTALESRIPSNFGSVHDA